MRYIGKRKVTLTLIEAQTASFSEQRDKEIFRYLKAKSLPNKLDILFALCRPPPSLQNYNYDRKRIRDLHTLRNDYVHRGWVGRRLPQGDDDLVFLSNTTTFLFHLVTQRYGIRLDPNALVGGSPRGDFPEQH